MENTAILLVSIISLLIISNFTFYFSKKINFPYTLLLVLVGIILIPISQIPVLSFLDEFELNRDVLFYIFLPVLLFEAAYNIHYRGLLRNLKAISLMAVVGLTMSTMIVGFGLFYLLPWFGLSIPLAVAFLFGAIISATDPVAVVALFKEYGAPKRLGLLFEGESLFNDGTAVAFFMVILGVIQIHGGIFSGGVIFEGFIIFASLIVFGVIFGLITGYIFSKAMGLIKDENVQITFSLLSAHLTFILAELITEHIKIGEFDIHISGIIATVISAMVIGNFGRYKLSPKAESYTDKFWHYFAFVSNSFVFILLGLAFSKFIDMSALELKEMIIPMLLGIVITAIARAVSIYGVLKPLNAMKIEKEIPSSWMLLLSWGSLRGSLAIIMVYMIPENLTINGWEFGLSIRDFIFVMVSSSVVFTLFVKGLTIGRMIKKLRLDLLEELEEFEYYLGKANTYREVLIYIDGLYNKKMITESEYKTYFDKFSAKIIKQKRKISEALKEHPEYLSKALKFYALGIERSMLKEMYQKNLISEQGYRKYKDNILLQKEMLRENKSWAESFLRDISDNISKRIIFKKNMNDKEKYLYYRTLSITSSKVIEELNKIKENKYLPEGVTELDSIMNEYEEYFSSSNKKKTDISEKNSKMREFKACVLDHEIIEREGEVLNNISDNDFITSKLNSILKKEFKEHKDD